MGMIQKRTTKVKINQRSDNQHVYGHINLHRVRAHISFPSSLFSSSLASIFWSASMEEPECGH